MKSIVSHA